MFNFSDSVAYFGCACVCSAIVAHTSPQAAFSIVVVGAVLAFFD